MQQLSSRALTDRNVCDQGCSRGLLLYGKHGEELRTRKVQREFHYVTQGCPANPCRDRSSRWEHRQAYKTKAMQVGLPLPLTISSPILTLGNLIKVIPSCLLSQDLLAAVFLSCGCKANSILV